MEKESTVQVVCGIIIKNGMLLVARRGQTMNHPMKWELPGGKVEKEETVKEAVLRELEEELGIKAAFIEACEGLVHHYPDYSICLIPVFADIVSGNPEAGEHHEIRWVFPEEAEMLDWADADRRLLNMLGRKLRRMGFGSAGIQGDHGSGNE